MLLRKPASVRQALVLLLRVVQKASRTSYTLSMSRLARQTPCLCTLWGQPTTRISSLMASCQMTASLRSTRRHNWRALQVMHKRAQDLVQSLC